MVTPPGLVCPAGGLPEDSPELEAVETFADYLRLAPPPRLRDEPTADYAQRIGPSRAAWWTWTVANDPGLRAYIGGGPWL